ncbi:MAG: hypothetical protein QME12_01940 [Nanoarchaeota archaeon]|nr:hypothetical protein [Nanoarchaeota archaeon]
MKQYKAKSIIVGRKKGEQDDVKPCFISMFNGNDPQKTGEAPFEVLDFDAIHKVVIEGLDVSYLLPGNDLVVNDLESFSVKVDGEHIHLSGKQSR